MCSSYLKHPASEEMLAAHSAERWARRNEPCRSYGLQLTVPKKNEGLTDTVYLRQKQIFLN